MASGAHVRVEGVRKSYGGVAALADLDLELAPGHHRAAGAQRGRQDHPDPHPGHPAGAQRRRGPGQRLAGRQRRRSGRDPPPARLSAPGPRPVPEVHGVRVRRLPGHPQGAGRPGRPPPAGPLGPGRGRAGGPGRPQDPHPVGWDAPAGRDRPGDRGRPRAAVAGRADHRAGPRAADALPPADRRPGRAAHGGALDPPGRGRGRGLHPGDGAVAGPGPVLRHPDRAAPAGRRPGVELPGGRRGAVASWRTETGAYRVLGPRPSPAAEPLPPTVEDGYLLVCARSREEAAA